MEASYNGGFNEVGNKGEYDVSWSRRPLDTRGNHFLVNQVQFPHREKHRKGDNGIIIAGLELTGDLYDGGYGWMWWHSSGGRGW